MNTWTDNELNKIGNAEELQIASFRQDGTSRKPRIIWVVRLGNDLYVRSVNGRTSDWFRGVQMRHEGNIRAGGLDKDAPSSKSLTQISTSKLTLRMQPSITVMPASSPVSTVPQHEPRPSNLCRVQQAPS